jgi:putative ABC transport system substrate-binding protein
LAGSGGGRFSAQAHEVLQDELRERGWIEGQNISFEHRIAGGRNDLLAEFAAELVRLDVSVILTSQSTSTIAAKEATREIPIVMVGNGDPVRYGLVTNLARPDGNVTGVSFLVNEMAVNLLELLKEANPRLAYVAVFVNAFWIESPITSR